MKETKRKRKDESEKDDIVEDIKMEPKEEDNESKPKGPSREEM